MVGDYVLRNIFAVSQEPNMGKLRMNWEGPYRITKITHEGSYKLENMDGKSVKENWNVAHLKRF